MISVGCGSNGIQALNEREEKYAKQMLQFANVSQLRRKPLFSIIGVWLSRSKTIYHFNLCDSFSIDFRGVHAHFDWNKVSGRLRRRSHTQAYTPRFSTANWFVAVETIKVKQIFIDVAHFHLVHTYEQIYKSLNGIHSWNPSHTHTHDQFIFFFWNFAKTCNLRHFVCFFTRSLCIKIIYRLNLNKQTNKQTDIVTVKSQ